MLKYVPIVHMQTKAEAAAAASVKEELERQIESLRRQLADAQAGTPTRGAAALPTAVSSDGTAAAAAGGTVASSGAVRDAALLAAELRTTQVQLQHVMHERQAAQSLAEQHKSSAESLERHRDALHKTISELRFAKEVQGFIAQDSTMMPLFLTFMLHHTCLFPDNRSVSL